MADTNFSKWLDDRLDEPGVNPTMIAAQAGISPSYLSFLRHGDRKVPTNKVLRGLASAFGASLEEVFAAAERPYEKQDHKRPAGEAIAGSARVIKYQEVSVSTRNVTLSAHFTMDADGSELVKVQFTSSDGHAAPNGALRWFINGKLSYEYLLPVPGVTSLLSHGENELRGIWEEETLELKFIT